jgi:hypothetical protein
MSTPQHSKHAFSLQLNYTLSTLQHSTPIFSFYSTTHVNPTTLNTHFLFQFNYKNHGHTQTHTLSLSLSHTHTHNTQKKHSTQTTHFPSSLQVQLIPLINLHYKSGGYILGCEENGVWKLNLTPKIPTQMLHAKHNTKILTYLNPLKITQHYTTSKTHTFFTKTLFLHKNTLLFG